MFANSVVKEDAISLVLGCLAAAPAWIVSLPAGYGSTICMTGGGESIAPIGIAFAEIDVNTFVINMTNIACATIC